MKKDVVRHKWTPNHANEGQEGEGDYSAPLEDVGQDALGAEDIDRQGEDGGNRPSEKCQ